MKCIGCGAKLQTTNQDAIGYISEAHLFDNQEEVYCKRCFDIIHYNKRYTPCLGTTQIKQKMKSAFSHHPYDLVCLLVDALDIYNSLTQEVCDLVGKMKLLILINKIDLLPRSIKRGRIEENILTLSKSLNLNVVSVQSISGKRQEDVLQVLKKIDKLRYNQKKKKMNFNNCFIIGYASVGKSTFINTIKDLIGQHSNPITTSDQFQTTQDFIKIYLGNKMFLYDTPGIINDQSYNYYLNFDSTKYLLKKNPIHVRVFQLNNQQTLFIGGLLQLDILEGEKTTVSLFISDNLYVHRTKLENAIELKEKQQFKMLIPPLTKEELDLMGEPQEVIMNIENGAFYDLAISGLGFLHLKGQNLKIRLTIPEKIDYKLVKSIL